MTSHMRNTMLAIGAALMLSTSVARADEWNRRRAARLEHDHEVQ